MAAITNFDRSNLDLASIVMESYEACHLDNVGHLRANCAAEIAARIQSVTPPPPPPPRRPARRSPSERVLRKVPQVLGGSEE